MILYQKLSKILSARQHQQIAFLLCCMIVGMLLETISIGVVIPVLAFMTKSDIRDNYPALRSVLAEFGNYTQAELIIWVMLILVFIYLVKTVFLSWLTWKQNRFVSELSVDISSKLFAGYLRQSWVFHLQRNSAQLTLNINSEVALLISTVQSCILLVTDGLVLVGITILLTITEPLGTLTTVSVLGSAVYLLYRSLKNILHVWGSNRQHHEGLRIQHLQQGFGGVKDIKLLGREDDFSLQFTHHNASSAYITAKLKTMVDLNRLWLELFGMMGLALLVTVMILHKTPLDALLPNMGLFAAAAFKLLPSINRMTGALQNVRYLMPAIDKVYEEMQIIDNNPLQQDVQPLVFTHAITLDHVGFQYKNATLRALQDVKIIIQRGMSVGFIGTSGAGKSTLVDIILGLLPPDVGCVKVDGADIQTNLRGWQDQIGYVPQSIFLTDDSIRRNITFGISETEIDDIAVQRALKAAQLDDFINSLPQGIHTLVGERGVRLSGGQRQRIGIARALYHDPAVLVLDEATSSLDLGTEEKVMQAVNALRGNKTLIIVAHRLSTLVNCDLLYKLEHGRIVLEGNFECVTSAV